MPTFTQSIRSTGGDTANDGTENDDSNTWDSGSVLIGRLSGSLHVGLRFFNVTIPPRSKILSAVLTFRSDADRSGAVETNIYGVKELNFSGFSSSVRPSTVTKTSNFIAWDFSTLWLNGNQYDSADFTAVVQEIVDQYGWESGNAMGIMVMNDKASGNDYRDAKDYNDNSATSFVTNITITYTDPPVFTFGNALAWSDNGFYNVSGSFPSPSFHIRPDAGVLVVVITTAYDTNAVPIEYIDIDGSGKMFTQLNQRMWYMLNPPTGDKVIRAHFNAGGYLYLSLAAACYVGKSFGPRTLASGSTNGTINPESEVDDLVVSGLIFVNQGTTNPTITFGSGITNRAGIVNNQFSGAFVSDKVASSPSTSLTIDTTPGTTQFGVAFIPFSPSNALFFAGN